MNRTKPAKIIMTILLAAGSVSSFMLEPEPCGCRSIFVADLNQLLAWSI